MNSEDLHWLTLLLSLPPPLSIKPANYLTGRRDFLRAISSYTTNNTYGDLKQKKEDNRSIARLTRRRISTVTRAHPAFRAHYRAHHVYSTITVRNTHRIRPISIALKIARSPFTLSSRIQPTKALRPR